MCKAVLLDNDNLFYSILGELVEHKELTKDELSDWEIFCFYKNKTKFNKIKKNLENVEKKKKKK
jgi:hypothetical protein